MNPTPPTPGSECYAAIVSLGRDCLTCRVECYRRGWTKKQTTADNRRLVEITRRQA